MLIKILKLTFKGEVNYHATAHRALKWSQFIPKVGCKVNAFMSLIVEELKKETKKERNKQTNKQTKIDNLRFYKSLVHAYLAVIMNDLGLDRKVFCQSSRLQSFKTYNFTCSELFHFL